MRAARFVVNGFLILALLGWGFSLLAFLQPFSGRWAEHLIGIFNALGFLSALACLDTGRRRFCGAVAILGTAVSLGLCAVCWPEREYWTVLTLLVIFLPAFFSWICTGCFLFLRATRDHPSLEREPSPRYAVDDPE